jgi:hypothetical protein
VRAGDGDEPERTFLPISQYLSPCLQASFSLLQGLSFFINHVLTLIAPFFFSYRQLPSMAQRVKNNLNRSLIQ